MICPGPSDSQPMPNIVKMVLFITVITSFSVSVKQGRGSIGVYNLKHNKRKIFKKFLIIYSRNIQTFQEIACYTKYIRDARIFTTILQPFLKIRNPKKALRTRGTEFFLCNTCSYLPLNPFNTSFNLDTSPSSKQYPSMPQSLPPWTLTSKSSIKKHSSGFKANRLKRWI